MTWLLIIIYISHSHSSIQLVFLVQVISTKLDEVSFCSSQYLLPYPINNWRKSFLNREPFHLRRSLYCTIVFLGTVHLNRLRRSEEYTSYLGIFTVMPFELCHAPVTIERLMENVLRRLLSKICLVYLYDVIIFGGWTFKEHLYRVRQVFIKFQKAGCKLSQRIFLWWKRRFASWETWFPDTSFWCLFVSSKRLANTKL